MLWMALHLPWLCLEALPIDEPQPACVIEHRRVLAATRAARAAGIEPSMSASTASSLAPGVRQWMREPRREAEFVRTLALVLGRYTPQLVLQPDGVWLEVAASLRLFGGPRALARRVHQSALECGAHPRLALAPTALGAALLARVVPAPGRPGRALRGSRLVRLLDALALAPVLEALRQAPQLADLLHATGCRRVADVRALPRAGLQRRGGGELLLALDRAYGDAPDPQHWFEPPEAFSMWLELMHRADDAAQLVFAAQRLVQPLTGWLARRWLAASLLTLRLRHERGRHGVPDDIVRIEFGTPSREAAQIMALLRERLQRHRLGAPVYAIGLELDEALPCAGHPVELLPDPGRTADAGGLHDRLAARLGAANVLRIEPADDHRPERATATHTHGRAKDRHRAASPAGEAVALTPRPSWLLSEPLRLSEQGGLPVHGVPLVLRTRAERIEAGWFDDAPVCRDYHLAEGADHRLRWIFRTRGRPGDEAAWYLHGWFG